MQGPGALFVFIFNVAEAAGEHPAPCPFGAQCRSSPQWSAWAQDKVALCKTSLLFFPPLMLCLVGGFFTPLHRRRMLAKLCTYCASYKMLLLHLPSFCWHIWCGAFAQDFMCMQALGRPLKWEGWLVYMCWEICTPMTTPLSKGQSVLVGLGGRQSNEWAKCPSRMSIWQLY